MSTRVLRMRLHNLGPIEDLEAEPMGRSLMAKGSNETGKSTFLNWLRVAARGAKYVPDEPVKQGEKSGKYECDIEHEGVVYQAELKVGLKGTHTVTLRRADDPKATIAKPQTLLSSMFGDELATEAARFLSDSKLQLDYLAKATGVDPRVYANKIGVITEKRRQIGRDVDQLKGELAAKQRFAGVPAEEQDPSAILDEINAAAHAHAEHDKRIAEAGSLSATIAQAEKDIDIERTRLARIEPEAKHQIESEEADRDREIAAINARYAKRIESIKNNTVAATERCEEQIKLKQGLIANSISRLNVIREAHEVELVDIESIKAKAGEIEATNRKVRANREHADVKARLEAAEASYAELTADIAKIGEEKEAAIKAAKLPVESLDFDETGLRYNGVPVSQASEGARQEIILSLACEVCKNGVVVLVDNLAMDKAHYDRVRARARERNVQLLVEFATWEDGPLEIVIEPAEEA